MRQFEQPDLRHYAFNSVCLTIGEYQHNDVHVTPIVNFECDEVDRKLGSLSTLFVNPQAFLHNATYESMVQVVAGDSSLCALLDTGLEFGLISESALTEV